MPVADIIHDVSVISQWKSYISHTSQPYKEFSSSGLQGDSSGGPSPSGETGHSGSFYCVAPDCKIFTPSLGQRGIGGSHRSLEAEKVVTSFSSAFNWLEVTWPHFFCRCIDYMLTEKSYSFISSWACQWCGHSSLWSSCFGLWHKVQGSKGKL